MLFRPPLSLSWASLSYSRVLSSVTLWRPCIWGPGVGVEKTGWEREKSSVPELGCSCNKRSHSPEADWGWSEGTGEQVMSVFTQTWYCCSVGLGGCSSDCHLHTPVWLKRYCMTSSSFHVSRTWRRCQWTPHKSCTEKMRVQKWWQDHLLGLG